jgi:hypothetical protein
MTQTGQLKPKSIAKAADDLFPPFLFVRKKKEKKKKTTNIE